MNVWTLSVPLVLSGLLAFLHKPGHAANTPNFREIACPSDVPAPADRCGFITVAEVHAAPNGKRIELFVAVKRASAPLKRPDPIFYLEGGPGAPGSFAAGVLGSVFPEHDVIGIDQHGMGAACPHCSAVR